MAGELPEGLVEELVVEDGEDGVGGLQLIPEHLLHNLTETAHLPQFPLLPLQTPPTFNPPPLHLLIQFNQLNIPILFLLLQNLINIELIIPQSFQFEYEEPRDLICGES